MKKIGSFLTIPFYSSKLILLNIGLGKSIIQFNRIITTNLFKSGLFVGTNKAIEVSGAIDDIISLSKKRRLDFL